MFRARETSFRVRANRDEVRLDIDEHFWNETIISQKDGTTQLDFNISTVVEEIRVALYYIAAEGTRH